jgi:hypothetical protein
VAPTNSNTSSLRLFSLKNYDLLDDRFLSGFPTDPRRFNNCPTRFPTWVEWRKGKPALTP